ncbi:MAG: tandem-95 repeat protein [Chitinophagaceae bacterium]
MKQLYFRLLGLAGMLCAFSSLFAQSSTLTCNTTERLIPSTHASLSQTNSGGSAVTYALVGGVLNAGNVIDADTANFATLGQVVASLGTKYISVKDGAAGSSGYTAGTYAGFEVSFSSLLSVSLLSDISISTYLAGSLQETKTAGSLLVSSSLLSAGTRGKIGFVTTLPFDEVRYSSSGVSVLPSEASVYNVVLEKFCAGPSLNCNTATTLAKPSYPLTIDNAQTGISGAACVACAVSNPEYAIDNSTASYAGISLTVGILASGSVAVTDNVSTYTAGTFAGFDIESTSLLTAGVLNNLTIATYNNGVATGDVASGASLVSAGSSLLSGSSRQVIGFLTTQAFDEVKITAANTVSVSLGLIRVYGAVMERFCSAALPACNTLTALNNPGYPVYVNGQRTGVNAALCAACAISNSQNIIDNNASTYASVDLTAGVAVDADFSVANALDTYPAGTFAGFDLETNSLLLASVISTATINLYNNGTLVQTGSGNALIVGASTSLLSGTSRQTAGIVSTVSFDEVQISFNQLVGADLGTIKLYGMQIEKTCAPTLQCNKTYYLNAPDFPAVINIERTGASGVATVDVTIEDPWNVVSAGTADYARINNTATVLATGSISVLDPTITYPQGTFAGFVIRTSAAPLVLADLFSAITVRTYNNGVLQETRSGGGLVNLTVLATLLGTTPSGAAYNVGFYTTQAFDEIRISVGSLLSAGLLDNYVDVFGAFVDTRTSVTGSSAVTCFSTYPDVNQTYLGQSVSGNLSTNDVITSGTRYGAAVAVPGNPSASAPVVNSDGTYTFISSVPGTYHFLISVCATDSSINCPQERLTIVVLPSKIGIGNPPVANTDYTATSYNTPLTVYMLSNDAPGTLTAFLDSAGISLTDLNGAAAGNSARGGTATVSSSTGLITYTPASGFSGTDTLQYTVCDNQPSPLCASAYVIITVWASGASNTTMAMDDYAQSLSGVPLNGNLKVNDHDPEGDNQTITPQSITTANYTFTLDNAGNYTFSPVASFAGPVEIAYTTCDNGTPSACSQATMRFLVAMPWKTNADFNAGFANTAISGNVATNDQIASGSSFSGIVADGANPSASVPTLSTSGSYSFLSSVAGVYHFYVTVCPPAVSSGCPVERLTLTIIDTSATASNPPIANTDLATTKFNTPVQVRSLANDGGGMPGVLIDTASVTLFDLNGATAGNTARGGTATAAGNGVITYTPAINFVGLDTIRYQVCDNQAVPRCASAFQVITVLSPTAANTTAASDDFKTLLVGTTISGNVRLNDMDPEGDWQTITPQTISTASYTFTLDTAGNFTFAPLGSLFGPQDISYQTCDNGSPQACTNATMHFLVSAAAFALPLDLLRFTVHEADCETYAEWVYGSAEQAGSATLFRSPDGKTWEKINEGTSINGNTEAVRFASFPGKSYYRLRAGYEHYEYTGVQSIQSFLWKRKHVGLSEPRRGSGAVADK